jgi:hypothetical protein
MSGSFTIGLIEVLAYLFPGGLVLASILYGHDSDLGRRTLTETSYQVLFIACAYITGHLITLFSFVLVKLRALLKKVVKAKTIEEELFFYEPLLKRLHMLFGMRAADNTKGKREKERDQAYLFSSRLITDNSLPASQVVDRLYALTVFSRNTSFAFGVAAVLLVTRYGDVAAGCGILAACFFLRYAQMERNLTHTVFRAAYVYLSTKRQSEEQKPSGPKIV